MRRALITPQWQIKTIRNLTLILSAEKLNGRQRLLTIMSIVQLGIQKVLRRVCPENNTIFGVGVGVLVVQGDDKTKLLFTRTLANVMYFHDGWFVLQFQPSGVMHMRDLARQVCRTARCDM